MDIKQQLIAGIDERMAYIHEKTYTGDRQEYFEGKYQGLQSSIDIINTLMPDNLTEQGEWVSVEDDLPEVGEWVTVMEDRGAYSSVDEHGEPEYWFSSAYYNALVFDSPLVNVTCGQLRYVSDEGWGHWQQGSLASGHALVNLQYVSKWMKLPEPPK